jgi:hypothetical protein
MIVVALGAAFSVGLRTMNDTSSRLGGSNDAQLVGVHFPPDVESATEAVASASGVGITCTGATNPVLELSDGGAFDVVYGVRAAAGSFQLERHVCAGGAVQSTRVIARNLGSITAAVPARLPATGRLVGATLTITERAGGTDVAPYVFTVRGNRRSS